jgi:hypothetical protein
MLFDLASDPHEQHDLAEAEPGVIRECADLLAGWRDTLLAETGGDPMDTVMAEGGSLHAREKGDYFARLRATGRGHLAEKFERRTLRGPDGRPAPTP